MKIRNIIENILFILICVSIISSLYLLFIGVPFVGEVGDGQGENDEKEKQDTNLSEAEYPEAYAYDGYRGGGLYASNSFNLTSESGIERPEMLVEENTEWVKSADSGILEFQDDSSRFEIQWSDNKALIEDRNKNQFYIENPVLQDDINISSSPEESSLTDDGLMMIDGLIYQNTLYGPVPKIHDRTPEGNLSFNQKMVDIMESVNYRATEAEMSNSYGDLIKYEDQKENVESVIVVTSAGRIDEFNYSGPKGNITYSTETDIEEPLFKPIWAVES